MVDENSKVEGPYEVHDFTITSSDAVSGLSLMTLEDARAIGVATANAAAFAGVLATDKTALDARTEAGCYVKGIFKMTAAAGLASEIAFGDIVVASGQFIRQAAAGDLLTGAVVGKAMENIAQGTTGEVHVGASV